MYCKNWKETVYFYQNRLGLDVLFVSDWFIEFSLNAHSCLSIADQNRSPMKGGSQKGITLTLQVKDIDTIWNEFEKTGLKPTPIKKHPWDAHTFFIYDPEEHRIEIWESIEK